MKRSLEERLSDAYLSNLDIIGEGLPAGVNAARRVYLENFNLLALPAKGNEDYRHFNIAELFPQDWEQYFIPLPTQHVPEVRGTGIDAHPVDILNGFHAGENPLTVLDNGIVYGSLRHALNGANGVAADFYNRYADNDGTALTALNSVFMQDGAFVFIPDGVRAEKPFLLNFAYHSEDGEEVRLCFPRALIVAGKDSAAEIVLMHRQTGTGRFVTDFVREVSAGGNAFLSFTEITDMGVGSIFAGSCYMGQQTASRTASVNIWLRGGATRINSVTGFDGAGCESNFHGIYFGTGNGLTDINVRTNHAVPDCTSSQTVKGIVSDSATGAFTGRIFVARDAQRTKAFQQSRNLQLSDRARIYSEPQLEIYADDVKCSHGAAVGHMDEEAVFYMRQRGIDESDARRLQMFGFVNDVISKCGREEVCAFMRELAQERINEI